MTIFCASWPRDAPIRALCTSPESDPPGKWSGGSDALRMTLRRKGRPIPLSFFKRRGRPQRPSRARIATNAETSVNELVDIQRQLHQARYTI
jgi:hypothetical protein